MTQPADLQKGLVRILADGGEARPVVGAGFLVSSRHILTCAHVVADALEIPRNTLDAPTAPVWLDWPLVVGSAPMSAQVACWHPVKAEARQGELEDIAVLELDGERPLPDAAQPVPVVVVEEQAFFDRPVRMYGFAEDRGDWVNGQLQGPVATGWVQLDHELGRLCVAPGFSGTAVWDKRENATVGMIVSIATRENVRSAYMIPAASLIRAWPVLDEHSRPPNPYRGLEAFREQDARFFMGRDSDIQDVLAAVQQRSFVAMVGASGSGKSSLLFAGVMPRLRQQAQWLIADFRPRGDPFRELATALTLLLYPDLDELERLEKRKQLADKFSERNLNLVDVVDLLLGKHPGKRLLLIADQFEELYTQNLAPERRRQFVDELVAVVRAQAKKPVFTPLLALRVDFLGQALDYEPLAEWIKPNHLLLGPLGQAGLEAAIESPAQQLGVKLEEGLAERILQDLGQEPGALPLLEFALTQLWERQRHRQLTHAAYEAIGGVTQALARHADETLARFQDERERVRRVFVQLVRPGEGTEDTRQVATREQVGAANWNLVTELADERLVVTGRDTQGQETVEVVHEALLRHWQPLRQWIEQDRQFRVWQNRLRLALQEWQEQGRDEGALLRGARLAEAEERLNDHADELSQAEKEYIEASVALREREATIRRQGRRRVITGLVAGLAVALVLSGLATWQWREAEQQRNNALDAQSVAEKQRDEANRQRNFALIRQLAAQAALRLDNTGTGLVQSALLATESLQRDPTPSAYVTWARTMDLLPRHQPIRLTHKDSVWGIAFSPDGQRLATASWDQTARIWDAASGRELVRLNHEDEVESVTFSPDGQRLATAGKRGNTARVWDVASSRELARLTHEDGVLSVTFSPNGQRLATTSKDKTARVWDMASGRELARLTHQDQISSVAFSPDGQRLARLTHQDQISSVAFSPDGQRLATASDDKTARVWDVVSGRELARLPHEDRVLSVAFFGPNGQRLATASLDKTTRIWDAASGRELARLTHESRVWNMVFSPDGQRLAANSDGNTVRVWEVASGRELARLPHEGFVLHSAFSPDGQRLATASAIDYTARVWEVASGRELARMTSENRVLNLAFNPDGQRVAVAYEDKIVRIWGVASGRELIRLTHEDQVSSVVLSPDGQRLATASHDKTARVWDAASGQELIRLTHEEQVSSVTFSPDGQRLATASHDKTARVWDAASGQELARLTHEGQVSSVAFNPDGQRLATASDKTARVWDIASGRELVRLNHEDEVESVAFSPDGQRLATVSRDMMVRIWDTFSGRELAARLCLGALSVAFSPDGQRLAIAAGPNKMAWVWDAASGRELVRLAHEGWVTSVVFSPDGQRLATASDDKTARVWDAASGWELARLPHEGEVTSVAFSPDGQRLTTASQDKTARAWLWRAEDLIAEACKRLPRNLKHKEWRQYVGEEVPYHATCPNLPVPED